MAETNAKYGKYFIDSDPLPVCENFRHASHRTFSGMAQWAHSSTSTTFGLKLHMVVNERKKIVKFALKPGSFHDISCAEEVLHGCRGIAVVINEYCSDPIK